MEGLIKGFFGGLYPQKLRLGKLFLTVELLDKLLVVG